MSQEKVAVITGVSSGIGRAIAGLLSQIGFRVFGTARAKVEPKGPLEEVELLSLDVRDDDSVRSCVRTAVDRAGRIDALVNNAGYTLIGSLEETTIEEAKQLFETNFFGVLRMTQAVLPLMRGQGSGRIINIGSVVGFRTSPVPRNLLRKQTCSRGLLRIARSRSTPVWYPHISHRTGVHAHGHRSKRPSRKQSARSLRRKPQPGSKSDPGEHREGRNRFGGGGRRAESADKPVATITVYGRKRSEIRQPPSEIRPFQAFRMGLEKTVSAGRRLTVGEASLSQKSDTVLALRPSDGLPFRNRITEGLPTILELMVISPFQGTYSRFRVECKLDERLGLLATAEGSRCRKSLQSWPRFSLR